MASANLNRWLGTANLTRDPEIKELDGGTTVANMRIAVNGRKKVGGEWVDHPNYFDVAVFGGKAESVGKYLKKGSGVAIDGRLEYQEWENKEGEKRNRVVIIADNIQFTDGKRKDDEDPGDAPPVSGGTSPDVDEDIPF